MNRATETPQLQAAFRALADPTRRHIMLLLGENDRTVAQVAGHFEMTRAAVKKHLVVLEEGRIIVSETRGRERINRLNPAALKCAADWLNHFDRFWDERFDALKDAVEEEALKQKDNTND
jgi:DNA-binding transcriptional ArsR family regulator